MRRKSLRRKKSKKMKGGKDGPNCVDSLEALRVIPPHVLTIEYTLINRHTEEARNATVYTLKIDYPDVDDNGVRMRKKLTYSQIITMIDSYRDKKYTTTPPRLKIYFEKLPDTAKSMKTKVEGKIFYHNFKNCEKRAYNINDAIRILKDSLELPGERLGDTWSDDDKIQCLEILGWTKVQVRKINRLD